MYLIASAVLFVRLISDKSDKSVSLILFLKNRECSVYKDLQTHVKL